MKFILRTVLLLIHNTAQQRLLTGGARCLRYSRIPGPLSGKIKAGVHDGCLKDLHVLMLVDDTYRSPLVGQPCRKKMNVLKEFCDEHRMQRNATTTKFMGIDADSNDPFKLGDDYITRTQICN